MKCNLKGAIERLRQEEERAYEKLYDTIYWSLQQELMQDALDDTIKEVKQWQTELQKYGQK